MFVCCLSAYNLFPELLSNENPLIERVVVCVDFNSNSVVFVFVFYATSVLIINKSKKLKTIHYGFSVQLLFLEYFRIMSQNTSAVDCVDKLITIALYVHHIKIRRSTLSPMYCGGIEYEFRNVNVP